MKLFNIVKMFLFILPLVFVLGLGTNLKAQSAVSCHCFKDRDFKPADRFAADDYILATSFNSLLSRTFSISKKQIIMLKMSRGVPQNDLLIGMQAARTSGDDVNRLLDLRQAGKPWPAIIAGLEQQDKIRTDSLLEPVIAGISVEEAGSSIADAIMGRFYHVPLANIKKLRKAGLTEKEVTLLLILVHVGKQDQAELLNQRNAQGKSWSEIAHNMGIEPAEAGRLVLAYPVKQTE